MIRIALTQPDVRPYRTPVYNLLAAQPDIDLTVFADRVNDAPDLNPAEVGFKYVPTPLTRRRFGPIELMYHPAHASAVDPSRFDLVIHSWNAHYRTLWPALAKARKLGLPSVVWGHGYSKRDSMLRTALRNTLGRRADGVMLYTHVIAERLIERYGFARDRVFVAQNAIDQAPIEAAKAWWGNRPGELQKFQERHRLDPSQTVAFVSRLYDENRPGWVVEAVDRLKEKFPNVSAVIIGDGPERGSLEQLAKQKGIAHRVHLPGALYDEAQLAPWLMSSRVFCYPVNIGLSLLTAFGFGLPVVTSDNVGSQNPEIAALVPGKNGLTYPDGSLEGMVGALHNLLSDRSLQQTLSLAAWKTVSEEYTLANMVQGFLDATRLVDGVARQVIVT